MKRFFYIILVLNLIGILKAEAQNSPDFKKYADVSLRDFYNTVLECILDPDNKDVIQKNYAECIDLSAHFVADLIDPFPKDGQYKFDSYFSNIKMRYPDLLRNADSRIQIEPSNIRIKKVEYHDGMAEVCVEYNVSIRKGSDNLFEGESEALIVYPKVNNRYNYKVRQILPKKYIAYREAMIGDIDVVSIANFAKESMRKGDYRKVKDYLEKLIGQGEVKYLYDLARLYTKGLGVEKDTVRAEELLQTLYDRGDARTLGEMSSRLWRDRDMARSLQFAQKSAAGGDAEGHYLLGLHRLSKKEVRDEDRQAAKKDFESALRGGIHRAYAKLADIADQSRDSVAYMEYVEKGVAAGVGECFLKKGLMYERGDKLAKDIRQAEHYYRQAAYVYDDMYGYAYLGKLYTETLKDMEKALECYERGYSKGFLFFAEHLFKYYSGITTKDYDSVNMSDSIMACRERAVYYIKDMIPNDSSGELSYRGMRICLLELKEPDYGNAFICAKAAVENGYKEAQFDLAEMYFKGLGTKQDLKKAEDYFFYYTLKDGYTLDNYNKDFERFYTQRDMYGNRLCENPLRTERYCFALYRLGIINQLKHDYSEAESYLYRSLNFAISFYDKFNYQYVYSLSHYALGQIYADASDKNHYNRKKAIEHFRTSAEYGYDPANDELVKLKAKPVRKAK